MVNYSKLKDRVNAEQYIEIAEKEISLVSDRSSKVDLLAGLAQSSSLISHQKSVTLLNEAIDLEKSISPKPTKKLMEIKLMMVNAYLMSENSKYIPLA